MIPNLDPRAMKRMMESMGVKNTEIPAERVIIEGKDKNIVIENPSVTLIEMQGVKTFQIVGEPSEEDRGAVEISEEDIRLVKEKTGVDEEERIRSTLEETKGDIAEAIIKLAKKG